MRERQRYHAEVVVQQEVARLASDEALPGQLVGRLLGSGEGSAVPKGNTARGGAGAVGSGKDSHAEVVVRREVGALLRRLMEYRGYGFAWWCPVSRTLEQAGGACLRKMTGHTHWVNSVSFSADGRRVVSGSHGTRRCACGMPCRGNACWGRWRGTRDGEFGVVF